MNDAWQSGTAYERFMGRWSVLIARKFLRWLEIAPARSWLDIGCGTGSLTRLILENYQPAEVISIDSSGEFIDYARLSLRDPAVSFRVGQAQALELDSASMDAVVSGLVLNFVSQPEAALSEMLRVAKPGGKIGVFVWDYANGMQMLRSFWDAAVELDPLAGELDEGARFPLCREGQLESLFLAGGFKQVEALPVDVETRFQNFEDYWQPFLGGAGPASSYLLGLSPSQRHQLAEDLRLRLPFGRDGSITLKARAWAVKGTA